MVSTDSVCLEGAKFLTPKNEIKLKVVTVLSKLQIYDTLSF